MQVDGHQTSNTFYPASNINFQKTNFRCAYLWFKNSSKLLKIPSQYHHGNITFGTSNIINSSLKKKNIKEVKEKILI